jgi:hypothetical protein
VGRHVYIGEGVEITNDVELAIIQYWLLKYQLLGATMFLF